MKLTPKTDVLGNLINPGDYIVYGAAKGRCAGLNIGLVVTVTPYKPAYGSPGLKVSAEAVQVSFGRYERTGKDEYAAKDAKPRKVHLQFCERICVIPASIVPDNIKNLLK